MTSPRNKAINKSRDTFVQVLSDSMPCDTLERILQNLHLCKNEQLHKVRQ